MGTAEAPWPMPVEYADFMASNKVLFEFMMTAASGQLAMLKNVPAEPGRSQEIGLKMSEHILQYHCRPIEEVKSDPPEKANNVGNLCGAPFPHGPPVEEIACWVHIFSLLHLRQASKGWRTGLFEAELFRKEHPWEFAVLAKVPATFYLNVVDKNLPGPVPYSYSRPHFTLNHWGHITGVS